MELAPVRKAPLAVGMAVASAGHHNAVQEGGSIAADPEVGSVAVEGSVEHQGTDALPEVEVEDVVDLVGVDLEGEGKIRQVGDNNADSAAGHTAADAVDHSHPEVGDTLLDGDSSPGLAAVGLAERIVLSHMAAVDNLRREDVAVDMPFFNNFVYI